MTTIPLELLEQFERGNVLLFIGEHLICDVDHLATQLAQRCNLDQTYTFPQAAQVYEDEKGRNDLVRFVREQLGGREMQEAYSLIAGLTDCTVLVTTSLGQSLERAFEQAGRPVQVIISTIDVAFEEEDQTQLYKLHGTLERPESLVLTEDDYETFFRSHANLSIILQSYLARKTILFIGYDLSSHIFKQLYSEVTASLDTYSRRSYVVGDAPLPLVARWCKRHNIQVFEAAATDFLKELTRQLATRTKVEAPAPQPVTVSDEPLPTRPYKYLDYYEAQDASIFFGRQQETRKLASLIHAHRLVLLYGASGTGKTSLLLAGAAPWLERGGSGYRTVYVRALEDPATVIRRTVSRKFRDVELPEAGSLVDFLATAAQECTLVIILDQFEEFFIRLSPEIRAAFIAELGMLYDARDVPVKVVLSLREDWVASVNEIRKRIPNIFNIDMRLLSLTRDQARQSITAPVQRMGVNYEPVLVDKLLDDLSGSEAAVMPPQLQLVCGALYDHLGEGKTITLDAYEQLGGARGVLQKYLDDELARLPNSERALAHSVLEELVTSQRTKSVKTADELARALGVEQGELEPVLTKLIRSRLLRPVESAFELAHEYLIAEIALSPESMARKEAEELLWQGVENKSRFKSLLLVETFTLIDAQRTRLRLDAEAQELLLCSALRHGVSIGYWLNRMEDEARAVRLVEDALLSERGEAARQGVATDAGDIAQGRLRVLVGRLTAAWRYQSGATDAMWVLVGRLTAAWRYQSGATDALWVLRSHLPAGLRARLVLSRSSQMMRRVVLPMAGGVLTVLLIALAFWTRPLWYPKPKIEYVDVPAGWFAMGSDPTVDPDAVSDEHPQHPVYLDAYRIGKYEVTNAEYKQCVNAGVCGKPGGDKFDDPDYADHPVTYVTWFDAKIFSEWVGGRLPTEAEWEKAARGTDGRVYPWGEDIDCDHANYGDCVSETTKVGSYPDGVSPDGAYDMAGNVWEWTADWYDGNYYTNLPDKNPSGPDAGGIRVVRGGSVHSAPGNARCANRDGYDPDFKWGNFGFRVSVSSSLQPPTSDPSVLSPLSSDGGIESDVK